MSNLSAYQKKIEKALAAGNATEHTHRPALKTLIESLGDGITATNEPKRIKCGAPDFIVTRGSIPLGYIEAKDVGRSLDDAEESEQLQRYFESLPNLILTDYLEFRWYVLGRHRLTAKLATATRRKSLKPEKDGAARVGELLNTFLEAQVPTVSSARELAGRMASIARLIRETISSAFRDEDQGGSLHHQMEGFQKVLLHDLTESDFADMYAQTICYGLFAARFNFKDGERFTRVLAAYQLPKTNPFLRKMFGHIAGPDLDDRIVWAVDDLAELLDRTDIAAILLDFGKSTRQEDPVVHFYETFLAAYDPKMRESRGVYYTPEPVVSYIVRSVDHILKNDFGLTDGLADSTKIKLPSPIDGSLYETHRVLILDPATGTGTFLHAIIDLIYETFRNNQGMWSGYISEHLLPRLFGFELLMAPYTVAHMKLDLQLQQLGFDFESTERLRVYLTNALEEVQELVNVPVFTQWLAEEANAAGRIKREFPVMVVLGNPPYQGHSSNKNERLDRIGKGSAYINDWIVGPNGRPDPIMATANADTEKQVPTFIGRLMWDYMICDGARIRERNPKWINNDYVKFIRFAQWKIEQTGYGVLAFITDHGYRSNSTFRGMRQSLMNTFDKIYFLDLHGNVSKKKERAPAGIRDENVFQIEQGVAIGIFIKHQRRKTAPATVSHYDLWGPREVNEVVDEKPMLVGGKYHWLSNNTIETTDWTPLDPQSPHYLFIPHDLASFAEYDHYRKITDIFELSNTGLITSRDKFVTGIDEEEVYARIADFRKIGSEEAAEKYGLGDVRETTLQESWELVKKLKNIREHIVEALWRPFDMRFIFYHESLIRWPVYNVMKHMLAGPNIGLGTTRSIEIGRGWEHAFCTSHIMQHHAVSLKEVNYLFPLYRYHDNEKGKNYNLFDQGGQTGERYSNLSDGFTSELSRGLKLHLVTDGKGDLKTTFGPDDILNYMYAILHSPTYRSRYAEFLSLDFPRLPLITDRELFAKLCQLGDELIDLHLMRRLAAPVTTYPIRGASTIEKIKYTEPAGAKTPGRIWINKTQYFEGITPDVWGFHVGGYPVCLNWLKARKGRDLSYNDLKYYQHIIAAASETISLLDGIDETIEEHGGWPLG